MPWWIFVAGGIGIAAISSLITAKIVKKRMNAHFDDILEETSEELSKMKIERDNMYKSFVQSGDPATSKERAQLWKDIEEEVKKGRKQVANEHPEDDISVEVSVTAEPKIGDRRDVEDRENYQKVLTHNNYISNDRPDPTAGIIRKEAQNGIVEIEHYEAHQHPRGYPIEDLYFNEMTSDLYTDAEDMIEPADIPLYVGYSQEELALRFLHDDEPSDIYVINPSHGKIYNIYVRSGEWGT